MYNIKQSFINDSGHYIIVISVIDTGEFEN